MERFERYRGFRVASGRRGTRRAVAMLATLALGACFGSSTHEDDDDDEGGCRLDGDCVRGRVCVDVSGNRNTVCEDGEACRCIVLTPGVGGGAGTSNGVGGGGGVVGVGGSAVGGTVGEGGTGPATGCMRDEDCPGSSVCIDSISGDQDGFCETGEMCVCAGIGTGGVGGTGAGGRGGAVTGGSAGRGGGGTGGGTTTALGEPCTSSSQCGTGLTCLLSDGLPSGDGPPNGLCTFQCAADDECLEFANEAFCVVFEDDAAGNTLNYCILGCTGGAVGAPKCRLRNDFACGILSTTPSTRSCVDTNDCPAEQVCYAEVEGDPTVCHDMTTACIPVCRADGDCASGQFCDHSSGFCTAMEPEGLPIGALCDPNAAEDPCNGFCTPTDATQAQGTCSAFCSASLDATGCGWDGTGAPPEAGCLYATIISRDGAGGISLAESDLMLCGQLCDCNDDCPADIELCMDENAVDPTASIQAIFGRDGYCRPLLTGETTADSLACP